MSDRMDLEGDDAKVRTPAAWGRLSKILYAIFISYLAFLVFVNLVEVFSMVRTYKVPQVVAALGASVSDLTRLTRASLSYHAATGVCLFLGIALVTVLLPYGGLVFLQERIPNIFIPHTSVWTQGSLFMAVWGVFAAFMSIGMIPVGFNANSSSFYFIFSLLWVAITGVVTASIFYGLRRKGVSPILIVLALIGFNLFCLAMENVVLSAAKLVYLSPIVQTPENAEIFKMARAEDFPEQRILNGSLPKYSDGLLTEIITVPEYLKETDGILGYLASEFGRRRYHSTLKHYAVRALPLVLSPIIAVFFVLPDTSLITSFGLSPESEIAALPIADLLAGATSVLLEPFKLWLFRHETYGADNYAKQIGYGTHLSTALAKARGGHLPWSVSSIYEKIFMSEPSALHRIEELTK